MAVIGHVYEKGEFLERKYWIIQGPFSICGYIEISKDEFDVEFNDFDKISVEVHGGITFVGYLYKSKHEGRPEETLKCSRYKRYPDDAFVIGFDTNHAGDIFFPADDQTYKGFSTFSDDHLWTVEEVREECKDAIRQINEILNQQEEEK